MNTYLVPFEEIETVLVGYMAKVNASTEDEAFGKIKNIIDIGESPHSFADTTTDGIQYDIEAHVNLGIIEHIDSDCKYNMDDYSIEDVEKVDERVSVSLDFTAFDIVRLGKDEIYLMAEESFAKVGLTLEILEMEMIPTKIEEHFVSYDCVPTEYRRVFTDESFVHMKDGIKIGGNYDE